MNSLKIQIKPFCKNNPFHLKDDQIHILSTNKNEEEIKQLLLQMNYENYSIFIQLELENYNYGYLFIDHKEYELYYYNDFDPWILCIHNLQKCKKCQRRQTHGLQWMQRQLWKLRRMQRGCFQQKYCAVF